VPLESKRTMNAEPEGQSTSEIEAARRDEDAAYRDHRKRLQDVIERMEMEYDKRSAGPGKTGGKTNSRPSSFAIAAAQTDVTKQAVYQELVPAGKTKEKQLQKRLRKSLPNFITRS
jgi:hypothetical protein